MTNESEICCSYRRPTKPRVAMLMRTDGGSRRRSARKQAHEVLPVVNISSIRSICLIPFSVMSAHAELSAENAPATLKDLFSTSILV